MQQGEILDDVVALGGAPLDELCCPFDHGIIIPASTMLTSAGEHLLYYEGRVTFHEARYKHADGTGIPMAIGLAAWKRHRLAGVRHEPGHRSSSVGKQPALCSELVTKPIDLTQVAALGPYYFTVNVGFGGSAPTAANSSSALVAEVLRDCSGGVPDDSSKRSAPIRPLLRAVPVQLDSTSAVLRWRATGGGRKQSSAMLRTARKVRLRFVLCGSAKLYSFTAWRMANADTPTGSEDGSTSTASTGAGESVDGAKAAATLVPLPTPLHDLSAQREARWSNRWADRAAEMNEHAVVYGSCSQEAAPFVEWQETVKRNDFHTPHNLGSCPPIRPIKCAFPVAMAPDGMQPAIDGVGSCKAHCVKTCGSCRYASFSWAKYTCACYERCPWRFLAIGQEVDNTHPELLVDRPVISLVDGDPDPFDYVTFNVHEPSVAAKLKGPPTLRNGSVLRPFPQRLWNTTAEWAADWSRYSATLKAEGLRPYSLMPGAKGKGAGDVRAKAEGSAADEDSGRPVVDGLGENATGVELDERGRLVLGARVGFCGVTAFNAKCEGPTSSSRGAFQLSLLLEGVPVPHDWKVLFATCEQECLRCARCNYITVSRKADDCSWYESCDMDSLHTVWSGFYSKRVRTQDASGGPLNARVPSLAQRLGFGRLGKTRMAGRG